MRGITAIIVPLYLNLVHVADALVQVVPQYDDYQQDDGLALYDWNGNPIGWSAGPDDLALDAALASKDQHQLAR
jgi:hypothetical protein